MQYNQQQRINLNKNETFEKGDKVAIIHLKELQNLENKDKIIKNLTQENQRLIKKNNNLIRTKATKGQDLETQTKELKEKDNKINSLNLSINNNLATIQDLKDQLILINKELKEEKDQNNITLTQIKNNLNERQNEIFILNKEIENLENKNKYKNELLKINFENIILNLENELIKYNSDILTQINQTIKDTGFIKRLKGFNINENDLKLNDKMGQLLKNIESTKDNKKLE